MCVMGAQLDPQMVLSPKSEASSKQMMFETTSSRSVPYRVALNSLNVVLVSFSLITLSFWCGYHLTSINYWGAAQSMQLGSTITTNNSNSNTNSIPFVIDQSASADSLIDNRIIANKTKIFPVASPPRFVGHINDEEQQGMYHDSPATKSMFMDASSTQTSPKPKQMQFTTEYYESFVHPAMFTHDNPERIAIVSRGDTITSRYSLKEVLKHTTVKEVYMIGMDKTTPRRQQQEEDLNEWDDCGNLLDRSKEISNESPFCMDDPRVQLVEEDSLQWFLRQFPTSTLEKDEDSGDNLEESCDGSHLFKFDVLILDIL